MYHSKKIAVFISHIYGEYQSLLLKGISAKALELGYPLEIYATNDGEDLGNYGIGEKGILAIPNFDDIAGVIFASATYTDNSLKQLILDRISACKCPVVEVTQGSNTFTNVKLENNITAGELTKHCIDVHGCQRVCFLGHELAGFYSEKREAAYVEAIKEAGREVGPNDVFRCNETEKSYEEALEFFEKGGKFDAVIAYNDNVAMGFMEKALKKGYQIPEDFAITGCDYLESGRNIVPALTTVSFPLDEVGSKAMDSLSLLISGKEVEDAIVTAAPIYNESCGCKKCASIGTFQYLHNRNKKVSELELSMFTSMKISSTLSRATDIDDGSELIAEFVKGIKGINEFYMCLFPDWDAIVDPALKLAGINREETDFTQKILKVGVKNGKSVPECSFPNTSLLPAFVSTEANKAFIVSPLFYEEKTFGYIAVSFTDGTLSFHFELVQWMMNLSRFLRDCCEYKRAALLSKRLEEIYLRDSLTGLYNRHGFSSKLEKKKIDSNFVSLVLFDLDGLKRINDTYGHESGDFAIRTIGQAILKNNLEEDIPARFGGDEFYSLLFHDKEDYPKDFIASVEKYLNNFNNLSQKPFEIKTSAGFCTLKAEDFGDIAPMLNEADRMLYEVKGTRKRRKTDWE